jgi:hypothetical protein
MGFSEGRLSICPRKWRKDSSEAESPEGVNQPSGHNRRHREKRFHRPREALGYGYEFYEAIVPAWQPDDSASAAADPSAAEEDPERISEADKQHQMALNGVGICLWILLVVLLIVFHQEIVAFVYLLREQAHDIRAHPGW